MINIKIKKYYRVLVMSRKTKIKLFVNCDDGRVFSQVLKFRITESRCIVLKKKVKYSIEKNSFSLILRRKRKEMKGSLISCRRKERREWLRLNFSTEKESGTFYTVSTSAAINYWEKTKQLNYAFCSIYMEYIVGNLHDDRRTLERKKKNYLILWRESSLMLWKLDC